MRSKRGRDRLARRLLRVRGDDAVPALRRSVPRVDAPAKRGAVAAGARLRPPRRSPSSRRRSSRSSARCAANAALPPSEERLRLFDNAARFLASLAAEQRPAPVHRRRALGRSGHAVAAALSAAPPAQRPRARARRLPRDRARPHAPARRGARRMEPRTPGHARRARSTCRAPTRARCWPRCSACTSVSEEFVAALYRETEGNPFFIEEVIKSLIEQGQIYREDDGLGPQGDARARHSAKRQGSDRPAPEPPERDATVDVLRNGSGARQALSASASSPRSSPLPEDALLDALDEASAAQLIRANPGSARRVAPRRRQLRVHPRQDSRSPERGAESDPPAPPASAHRRGAGNALRPPREIAERRTSTRRTSPITSCRRATFRGR